MRKLASIQRIKDLEPIPGADAIEKATVLGWQLVVKKGEFQVGDLAVYCEIDSILPDRPEFEFLKPRGMRIRTIRLRGQVSQGICFALSVLPPEVEIAEGVDCTEALGVVKYEPAIPAHLEGIARGPFPSFIPKTDETRVQVLQPLLDSLAGQLCCLSEKLDGSSATYYLRNGEFGVCSRKLDLLDDGENSFWKVAKELDIEAKLRAAGRNLAIQGELLGEGIQGNKLRFRGQTVRFFDAFDIDAATYLPYASFTALMAQLDLPTVPVIDESYVLESDIAAIVQRAIIRSAILPDVWAEGIVIRPLEPVSLAPEFSYLFSRARVSFKAINPEFLLKYGE